MDPKKRTGQPTAFDAPPILTGKRKRATVSYVEAEGDINSMSNEEDPKPVEETITNDSDEDDAFTVTTGRKKSTEAPPKKRVNKIPKPKKSMLFRFLDLPPELRDMIYEMALVDHNEVSIVVRTKAYRQSPVRGPVYCESDYEVRRWNRRRSLKSGAKQVSRKSTTFVPALLAVNKQINAEAINYLYGHEFSFENSHALTEFLHVIGRRNQKRLEIVRIASWLSRSAAQEVSNRNGLMMLAGATKLTALVFDCAISFGGPVHVAKKLYQDGHHFMMAYGAANGSKDAVVNIIELDEANFPVHSGSESKEDQKLMFEKQLRALAKTL